MATPVFALRFANAIRAEITSISSRLLDGTCQSLSDYREQCGRVQGLRSALTIFEHEFKEETQRDDD